MTLLDEAVTARVPGSHIDLLTRPLIAALTTRLPSGQPHTQPVWFEYDEPYILVNTMRGFRKERNMRADPRVALVVVDPARTSRWLEVRGVVALTEDGALGQLDELARRYSGAASYFGGCVPAELAAIEIPVLGRIRPRQVAVGSPPFGGMPSVEIPASHLDLLSRRRIAVLSSTLPDGQPRSQPAWVDFDGGDLLIHAAAEVAPDSKATVLVLDLEDAGRWIEIRGEIGAFEKTTSRLAPRHIVCDAIHRSASDLE